MIDFEYCAVTVKCGTSSVPEATTSLATLPRPPALPSIVFGPSATIAPSWHPANPLLDRQTPPGTATCDYLRLPATACALVAQRPKLIGGAWSSSSLPGYAALTSTHSQPVIHRVSQPSGAFHPLQTSKAQTPSISCRRLRDRLSRSSPRCCNPG